jgi:hypothetical protein
MGSFQWIAELFELNVQAVRKRLFSGKRISLDESFEDPSPELLGESPRGVLSYAIQSSISPALATSLPATWDAVTIRYQAGLPEGN